MIIVFSLLITSNTDFTYPQNVDIMWVTYSEGL
jgi:hypothetical protein